MVYLFASVLFIICSALASAGIMTSIFLKKKYESVFFSSLVFFQLFLFIFGFYGIWGQLVVRSTLQPYLEISLFEKVSNISLLTAYPFMILSWLLSIAITLEMVAIRLRSLHSFIFISLNIAILGSMGVIIHRYPDYPVFNIIRYLFMVQALVYNSFSVFVLVGWSSRNRVLTPASSRRLGLLMMLLLTVMLASCFFVSSGKYMAYAFVLAYFIHSAFLPIYIRYRADFSPLIMQASEGISFEAFCTKFEISKREEEIIREICNGLSNQEIGERLFISTQTVKGHIYRIYMKTNLRSRAQLISLVNRFVQGPSSAYS